MSGEVCTAARAAVMILTATCAIAPPPAAAAQDAASTFKIAFFNIQSGKGEPPLAGREAPFADVANCTDPSQPVNAWAIGFVQEHLVKSIKNDPGIVALGLAESWPSVCASPENVRKVLGWQARTSSQNGVAMVAKYGFVGGEEWVQLDTSLNTNPADTMWALRMRVCLESTCARTINVFVAHWYGAGSYKNTSYDRQSRQTLEFLQRAGGSEPHVFVGDLNTIEGSGKVCGQYYNNVGLQPLRDAGYVDAWPLLHGSAEGFTGMTNRAGCGIPEGYVWKRPDYAWAPSHFLPISMTRFGVVPAGDPAPSDHYGIITEFPVPGAPPAPIDTTPPSVRVTSPTATTVAGGTALTTAVEATDDLGVARVEILEDGVVAHTFSSAPYEVTCGNLTATAGSHTIAARAVDAAGNVATSAIHQITVEDPAPPPTTTAPPEIVLYAKDAAAVAGAWGIAADPEAAGGGRMWIPDAGQSKLGTALAAPADYFELTFEAQAGIPYRLWMRGRADRNYWGNDSAFFQFSGSVTATGAPVYRIGTTDATWLGIEDCSGCAIDAWGWNDNGYGLGVSGPLVYFATSGPQTLRVQRREDGLSIDQIVLSPALYIVAAPGARTRDTTIVRQQTAPPPPDAAEILITTASVKTLAGGWALLADAAAAGGMAIGHPDAGGGKVSTALAAPANYAELTFHAEAGRTYRLWLRGRADRDHWANDSVFVQFDAATATGGEAVARIGTSDAFVVNLEEDSKWGLAGWGWQDNGYGAGVLGPLVTFDATGTRTIRIQTREDGLRIDQIVLSSGTYLTQAPGALKEDTTIVR